MLSLIEAGIIDKSARPVVLGSALAYGGILQLAAGMWAFVRNNTFAAVALGTSASISWAAPIRPRRR
jgi:uncharacterized protein